MPAHSDIQALIPGLRRYGRGLTGDAVAADDLTQETLVSALRSRGLGRGPALKRRLYAILTDFNRARAAALPDPDAHGGPARGEVLSFAGGRAPRAAPKPDPLASIPLPAREAILLVAVEGFAYAEAADIAGVSVPALVARLALARGEKIVRGGAAARRHLRVAT